MPVNQPPKPCNYFTLNISLYSPLISPHWRVLINWFTDLLHEEKQLTDHQTKYDYLKHRIQALMKDAEKAIFSNGTVTWKKSKDSVVLDQKALLQPQPELLQQYPQSRQGSRRFNVYSATA